MSDFYSDNIVWLESLSRGGNVIMILFTRVFYLCFIVTQSPATNELQYANT